MSKSIIKNYAYNLIYQVLSIIVPLITAPFLAKVLGAEGIGTFSFHHSIVYNFSLFVTLGLANYGNRSIARCLDDKEKIKQTFSEIYVMQAICGVLVTAAYVAYAVLWSGNVVLALCFLPFLLGAALDVSWYYFGRESFKLIVFRNTAVKLLTTAAILLFVRSENGVIIYAVIMGAGTLLSQVLIWPGIFKEKVFCPVKMKDVLKHIKPNLILFLPLIAVSVYRTMDKIMLGGISDMVQVGYYENAEKIVSLLLSVVTTLGIVMLPRMSALSEQKETKLISQMVNNSVFAMSLIVVIIGFGIAAVADDFVVVYYGQEFLKCGDVLKLLCITIPFISYANIIRTQLLIPQNRDKVYIVSHIVGAVVNLIINLCLIPVWGCVGAAIGTIFAEAVVCLMQCFAVRGEVQIRKNLLTILVFYVNGLIMYIAVQLVKVFLPGGIVGLLCQIGVGAVVMLSLTILQCVCSKNEMLQAITKKVIGELCKKQKSV